MSEVSGTFVFVDLAGFTALTEAHGDVEAAVLLDRFEGLARASLDPGDRLVKVIGDAVFLSFEAPEGALLAVERLLVACSSEPGFPLPRTGLHDGVAVMRGEDLIGTSVNLAARIAGEALGGQVLASAGVAAAARAAQVEVVDLGPFALRNVSEPVLLFELGLFPHRTGTALDPVCRMPVVRVGAAGHLRHLETVYWFCSLDCAARFAARPSAFVVDTVSSETETAR